MKQPVVLERLAEQDLEGHVDYIAADRTSAAVRFIDAAEAAFARLAKMPRIGAPRKFRNPRLDGIRCWPIPDFEKYLVFYRVTGEEVQVLRVLHGARDIASILEEGE